jgi:hypothetical protein
LFPRVINGILKTKAYHNEKIILENEYLDKISGDLHNNKNNMYILKIL